MPSYKLTYFNIRGRAEPARFLFALAGVAYEDDRFERESWPERKTTTPFGQVPVLQVDGAKLCQSNAITRYLAKQFGYAGKCDIDAAQCDMIADSLEDACSPVKPIFMEQDDAKKAEMKKTFGEGGLAESLARFEKLLCANKGGDGWMVGAGLTWADISFATRMEFLESFGIPICWEKFPKLDTLRKRVESQPKIAEWISKRPETPM